VRDGCVIDHSDGSDVHGPARGSRTPRSGSNFVNKGAGLDVAGYMPHGGILRYFIGMVEMPGEIRKDFWDETLPDFNACRRYLTAGKYQHLLTFIADERKQGKVWNMFVNNCNDFAAEAAREIGLKVPFWRFVPPFFLLMLSNMNT
jgi:hypothetical protein